MRNVRNKDDYIEELAGKINDLNDQLCQHTAADNCTNYDIELMICKEREASATHYKKIIDEKSHALSELQAADDSTKAMMEHMCKQHQKDLDEAVADAQLEAEAKAKERLEQLHEDFIHVCTHLDVNPNDLDLSAISNQTEPTTSRSKSAPSIPMPSNHPPSSFRMPTRDSKNKTRNKQQSQSTKKNKQSPSSSPLIKDGILLKCNTKGASKKTPVTSNRSSGISDDDDDDDDGSVFQFSTDNTADGHSNSDKEAADEEIETSRDTWEFF